MSTTENQPSLFDFEAPQVNKKLIKAKDVVFIPAIEKAEKAPEKPVVEKQAVETVSVIAAVQPVSFDIQKAKVTEILNKLTIITSIASDETSKLATQLGAEAKKVVKQVKDYITEVNKPHKEEIENNTTKGKEIYTPLDNDITRISNLITLYALEKEKQRQAELEKIRLAEEKKKAEEKAEKDRVDKIKAQLEKLKKQANDKSAMCTTSDAVTEVLTAFENWSPNPDFYQEFIDEATELKASCLLTINNRLTILQDQEKNAAKQKELEEKSAKLGKKEKALKEKEIKDTQDALAKKAQDEQTRIATENKQKAVQEQFEEMTAKEDLLKLGSKLEIIKVLDWTDKMVERFGSAKQAMANSKVIVAEITESVVTEQKVTELKSDKMKNMRTDFIIEVINPDLVPREYLCPDEKKIKEAVTNNRKILLKDLSSFTIAGVQITTSVKAIIK